MYIDLLIRIKNAQQTEKRTVKSDFAGLDAAVAEQLMKCGFLSSVEVKGRMPKKYIEVVLNNEKPIRGLQLLSKPSRRLYSRYRDLKRVKGGHGYLVLSTSQGVMTSSEARSKKVGGQKLFLIW